jgi:hypothetical protein
VAALPVRLGTPTGRGVLDCGGRDDGRGNEFSSSVAVLHHDITDIDSDSQEQAPIFIEFGVFLGKQPLDLHHAVVVRTLANSARTESPAVLVILPPWVADQCIDDHLMARQDGESSSLVMLHVAAEPLVVSCQDATNFRSKCGASIQIPGVKSVIRSPSGN